MARRSQRWTSIVVVGLATVLVAAAAGYLWVNRAEMDGGGNAVDAVDDSVVFTAAIVPDGVAPAPVSQAHMVVSASSHLPADGDIGYEPANTIDGDLATAWNSDAGDSGGRGETLTYRFVEPIDLRSIRFVNGYAKDDEVFGANHRIQRVRVVTDRAEEMLTLLDTAEAQEIAHNFGLTSKVSLEVVEIFEGTGFDNESLTADLAVTEVSFIAIQSGDS